MENQINYGIYVLYDSMSEAYGLPFVAPNKEVALRNSVSAFLSVDDNALRDFKLFEIGQFDIESGEVDGYPTGSSILVYDSDVILKKIIETRKTIEQARDDAWKELVELKKLKDSIKKNKEVY